MIKLTYGGYDHFFNEEDILTPGKHYNRLCTIQSDINEHLPTIKKYAEQCDSVTEMGVRFACSTWAFIEAKPMKLTCIDIKYDFFEPSDKFIRKLCKAYNIQFDWITSDSLKIEINKTDLLFIDTLHTYDQLYNELLNHSTQVNKYIILHDTTTFGKNDESIYQHASDLIKNKEKIKSGLQSAIEDFLLTNDDWFIFEVFTNNNGLTVLKRKEVNENPGK